VKEIAAVGIEYKEKYRALDGANHEALIARGLYKLGYING